MKTLSLIIALLFSSNLWSFDRVFQAEDQDLRNTLVNNGLVTGSKGKAFVSFEFSAPADGKYKFFIKGYNPKAGKPKVRLRVNKKAVTLKFPKGSQTQWQNAKGSFAFMDLKKGNNKIQVRIGKHTFLDAIAMNFPDLQEEAPIEKPPIEEPPVEDADKGDNPIVDTPDPSPYDPNEANERERLLDHLVGFGKGTTGGLGGELCRVTNLGDDGPGSLRDCAQSSNPRWVVFDVSGVIELKSDIKIGKDTTIDGRGSNITLTRSGLKVTKTENVIIHNITIKDGKNDDAISVYKSKNVWIDHVSVSNAFDGLIDITGQSRNVTVSWSKLSNHVKAMLIGSNNRFTEDKVISVTLHHNHYDKTVRRNPLVRFGSVHMFNNLISNWGDGAGGGDGVASTNYAQVRLENNIFAPASKSVNAVRLDVKNFIPVKGYVYPTGNLMLGDSEMLENEPGQVFDPSELYEYRAEEANADLKAKIEANAGRQDTPLWGQSVSENAPIEEEQDNEEEVVDVSPLCQRFGLVSVNGFARVENHFVSQNTSYDFKRSTDEIAVDVKNLPAGKYQLYINASGVDGASDSFFMSMDGFFEGQKRSIRVSNDFILNKVTTVELRNTTSTVIRIQGREGGSKVKGLRLERLGSDGKRVLESMDFNLLSCE